LIKHSQTLHLNLHQDSNLIIATTQPSKRMINHRSFTLKLKKSIRTIIQQWQIQITILPRIRLELSRPKIYQALRYACKRIWIRKVFHSWFLKKSMRPIRMVLRSSLQSQLIKMTRYRLQIHLNRWWEQNFSGRKKNLWLLILVKDLLINSRMARLQ
jgi:hypothetical protein